MSENNKDRLTELTIDEWIWVVFIILSILNITGDEIEKHFTITHELKEKELSKKIFKFTVFVSLLIYIYISYRSEKKYKIAKQVNKNIEKTQIRYFASILVVIASILLLYIQFNDNEAENPTIE